MIVEFISCDDLIWGLQIDPGYDKIEKINRYNRFLVDWFEKRG